MTGANTPKHTGSNAPKSRGTGLKTPNNGVQCTQEPGFNAPNNGF